MSSYFNEIIKRKVDSAIHHNDPHWQLWQASWRKYFYNFLWLDRSVSATKSAWPLKLLTLHPPPNTKPRRWWCACVCVGGVLPSHRTDKHLIQWADCLHKGQGLCTSILGRLIVLELKTRDSHQWSSSELRGDFAHDFFRREKCHPNFSYHAN